MAPSRRAWTCVSRSLVGHRLVAVVLACLAGTLAIPHCAAAASTVQYEAEARWYSAAPDDRSKVLYSGISSVPVSIGSLTPIDGRSGPCPDPSSDDYLCLRAYAAADIVALHAAARLTRKNVVGPVGHYARGVATVTFQQMNVVSPVPVVSGYVFLGLGGSATSSSSSGASVQAYPDVYVNDTSVQCLGGVCEPFQIPNFDGSFLRIQLWAYVAVNEDNQVSVDATADADFVNTLTVLSIELHDGSDQRIPDAVVTLTDQNNNVTFTFPNTIQATTTSTTIPGATTTTTVPPGGCEVAATYASIECRLAALDALVKASAGKLAPKLSKQLAKAIGGVQKAAQPGTPERRVVKRLRKAAQALRSYDTVLGSKKAKKTLDDGTRSSLQAAGAAVATDVARLLQALTTNGE
jgi:hypothetical protein